MKNKRKLLVNSSFKFYVIASSFFAGLVLSLFYFFLFVLLPNESNVPGFLTSPNELLLAKYVLVAFVISFGLISFLMGYLYSGAIFMGIFKRMSRMCQKLAGGKRGLIQASGFSSRSFN